MRADTGREPTEGQLLAMAYVDGELAESARREFEDRLRREPALAREVVELKAFALLLRQVVSAAPPGFEERLQRAFESPRQRRP